jgi:hypothetical protein
LFSFSFKNFSENIWHYTTRTALLTFVTLIFFIYFQQNLIEEEELFNKINFIPEKSLVFEKKDKSLISSDDLNQLETIFRQYENQIEKYTLYNIFSGFIKQNDVDWNFVGISINPKDIEYFFYFDSNISLQNLENGIAISKTLQNRFADMSSPFQLYVLSKDFETNIFSSLSLKAGAIYNENLNRPSIIIPTTFAEPLLQNGLANRGILKLNSERELSEIEYQLNQFGFKFIKFKRIEKTKTEVYALFLLILIFAVLLSKPVQKMSWLSIYYGWKRKKVYFLKVLESFFATLLLVSSLIPIALFFKIPFSIIIIYISIIAFVYFVSGVFKR